VDEGANPGLTLWEVEASRYERIFVDDQVRWTVDSGMNTAVSDDGRLLLGFRNEAVSPREHRLLLGDLSDLSIRRLDSFLGVFVDLDTDGSTAVTLQLSPRRAFLQVGKIVGQNPHLVPLPAGVDLYGLPSLSPDGRRVAMGYGDGSIRLHPVPDLDRPSYHALPHDELIARLKTLTNLRVVRDSESDTGWELEFGPFPGWETVPEW
jgi:hypothetical protein